MIVLTLFRFYLRLLTAVCLFFLKGNITTAVMLDREQAGAETYTMTVLAADDAIRSRQGTAQVRLGILHTILGVLKYTKNKIVGFN